MTDINFKTAKDNEIAIFGGGCFWCTEAIFLHLRGVKSAIPGYSGGTKKNPSYAEVSGGLTGHAEVVKIEYNPKETSFNDLLIVFFATHDPTTPNQQGNDIGSQYRSIILFTTLRQKKEAEKFIAKLGRGKRAPKIVTEVRPFEEFFFAEDYHKNYYENHPDASYCQLVIVPKLEKLRSKFETLLKTHETK